MYKAKLQELCHKRRWSLPSYSSMKDGPDHNPRFKSSVVVNGLSFHSSVSCKSFKHSQNDAAMFAYLHLTASTGMTDNALEGTMSWKFFIYYFENEFSSVFCVSLFQWSIVILFFLYYNHWKIYGVNIKGLQILWFLILKWVAWSFLVIIIIRFLDFKCWTHCRRTRNGRKF